MEIPPIDQPLTLTLAPDEALVLFDFLSRYEHQDRLVINDPAEDRVLTQLLGTLERHLLAPFDSRYNELLVAARVRVQLSATP